MKNLDEINNELKNAMSDEKLNRLNEIFRILGKSISNESSELLNELASIMQDYLLKLHNYELHIFRIEKAVELYRLNTKDENSFVGLVKMLESSSKEEIKRYFNKYLIDKSYVIMEKLSGLSITNQFKMIDAINKAVVNNCQFFIATHCYPLIEAYNVISLQHNKCMKGIDFINKVKII